MVNLSCTLCSRTLEVPATVTVTEDLEEGWKLDVSVQDSKLLVEEAYCTACQPVSSEQE